MGVGQRRDIELIVVHLMQTTQILNDFVCVARHDSIEAYNISLLSIMKPCD